MKHLKNYLLLFLVVVITISLPFLSYLLEGTPLTENLPTDILKHLLYQPLTLGIALVLLIILRFSRKEVFQTYFRKGDSSARILPEPYVGIRPKPGETWARAGVQWAFVISVVTVIVIYFQLYSETSPSLKVLAMALPFALVFALTNSFVEEIITRLGVVVALDGALNDRTIAIVSGILFGSVHYFGRPGRITGIIVAGFLGWLLAKSILETKGIFWAWLIHFLQDVIIMMAMFSSQD
jgi:uncharacterized protein